MSLQLVIPWRVALQQSSPPLHQLSVILKEKRKFEKEKSLNCKCANSKLSQQRGSPQVRVYYMYWLRDAAWNELSRRVHCCYQNCCGARYGLSAVGVWASAQVVTDG